MLDVPDVGWILSRRPTTGQTWVVTECWVTLIDQQAAAAGYNLLKIFYDGAHFRGVAQQSWFLCCRCPPKAAVEEVRPGRRDTQDVVLQFHGTQQQHCGASVTNSSALRSATVRLFTESGGEESQEGEKKNGSSFNRGGGSHSAGAPQTGETCEGNRAKVEEVALGRFNQGRAAPRPRADWWV